MKKTPFTKLILPLAGMAAFLGFSQLARSSESFETAPQGALSSFQSQYGTITSAPDNAAIIGKAKSGKNGLRILGGTGKSIKLDLKDSPKVDVSMNAWAERWTSKPPFQLTITAETPSGEKTIYQNSDSIKTGGLNSKIEAQIPAGTKSLTFSLNSADNGGMIMDDLYIVPSSPMVFKEISSNAPVIPAMIRRDFNPVLRIDIATEGGLKPLELTDVYLKFDGTTDMKDIKSVQLVRGNEKPGDQAGEPFGAPVTPNGSSKDLRLTGKMPLESGINSFWVNVLLKETANIGHHISLKATGAIVGRKPAKIQEPAVANQRIGYTVAQPGDKVTPGNRVSKSFRIPGLVRTNQGTLIAVYDIRYNHHGDLPADIDVGIRRSEDGGQTWSPLQIALSCKTLTGKKTSDGCGDPSILVDRKTGRIWVAGVWSRGFHPIWNSKPGSTAPDDCGQFVLAYSDDDGKTWSDPINITEQVKNIETGTDSDWGALFQGPGNGICLKDGTLVFPAQYWAVDKVGENKTARRGHSTIVYSQDHGKTWHCGTGFRPNTSECQVVELKDGSIMINARDESRSGYRVVYVTKDLGKTWTEHPSSQNKNGKGLMEPGACQASIERVFDNGPAKDAFFFSNPASHSGRNHMTIKASMNEGATWPEKFSHLYDERPGFGYSALCPVDSQHIGVLYEGNNGFIYFLKFPYKELLAQ